MKSIITIALLLVVLGLMSKCGYSTYRAFKDFPEEAKKEVLFTRYSQMLSAFDQAIANSDTPYSLAAKLENINYPEGTKRVFINEADDGEPLDIIGTSENYSKSSILIDGSGYGKFNGEPVWVINYPLDNITGSFKNYDYIEVMIAQSEADIQRLLESQTTQ